MPLFLWKHTPISNHFPMWFHFLANVFDYVESFKSNRMEAPARMGLTSNYWPK